MSLIATLLLLTAAAGSWRILQGPTGAERALGIQLVSTSTLAVLVVLAELQEEPALRDVAFVLALLAAVVIAALVQRLRETGDE
jgi:multicomponent Na+:H+ antiporter subunit F